MFRLPVSPSASNKRRKHHDQAYQLVPRRRRRDDRGHAHGQLTRCGSGQSESCGRSNGACPAQWAAEIAGKPTAQQLDSLADDYTEFNVDYPTLLVGKTLASGMGDVLPNDKAVFSDMQNSRVQVYGDTAILTYNFTGIRRAADGKTSPALAKSTRVYVKEGGHWMLVHANFAPAAQMPQR